MSVEVEGDVTQRIDGIRLSVNLCLEGTAVSEHRDGSCSVIGEIRIRKRVDQRGIIPVGIAVISDRAGIEAVDIYRLLSSLARRNNAAVRIAAVVTDTGHVPCDGVVIDLRVNTHSSV